MEKDKKRKKKKNRILALLIFILGFSILLYPLITRVYYDYRGSEEISDYKKELDKRTSKEVSERLNLAYAYNSAIISNEDRPLGDPFSDEVKEEGIISYARMLEVNEKIGVLTIPKIGLQFPIYAGTNDAVLQKGVGHLEGTSLPIGGLTTNSVLTAHRGLPENKLFTDLDKMKLGDVFYLETLAGDFAYKVVEIKVIEPSEIEALSIIPDRDLVTLLTCTPYMVNSHRLLVIGERTDMPDELIKEGVDSSVSTFDHLMGLFYEYRWIILVFFIILIYMIFRSIHRKKVGD